MNANEMKAIARNATITALMDALNANDAVQFGDASWAILQNVEDQEIWTEVTIKTKAYKATKTTPVFDPFEGAKVWQDEKEMKRKEKEEKAKEKEKKVKKAE